MPAAPRTPGSPGASGTLFGFSRPIWLIGWVSFFTDMASEMVYPLLPLFLTQVLGAGAMSLGVIEGAAEAANSALKILSGWWADRWRSPKTLVLVGYGLASAVRPLIALAHAWPQVLAIRFTDRLGKGIRGAPRDSMLAALAPSSARGRVYGFHRAMDHAGAVTGPLLASVFLYFYPGRYRPLFALTIIPGLIVMLFILRLPESDSAPTLAPGPDQTPDAPGSAWNMGSAFYRAIGVILLFSLGNASDAFLLLRLSDLGVPTFWIPLLWSALHVVKATSSLVGGALSDRFGRREHDRARMDHLCVRVCGLRLLRLAAHRHYDFSCLWVVLRAHRGCRESVGCRHGACGPARNRVRHLQRRARGRR